MDDLQAGESFRGLLLRHRGRTHLTQRELAARLGADRRTVQDWEAGLKHPTAERLQGLIGVLLEAGGLRSGHEAAEAQELWAAVLREAPRMHTPFDQAWFESLRTQPAAPPPAPAAAVLRPAQGVEEYGQDWGEAPDVLDFVGRADELARLRRWVLDEHSRLLAILGMGGIGKTSLLARLAQELAPGFERVYWRGLRDAPPVGDWLAGAIGFLSDQQLVPPATEPERLTVLLRLLRERRCLLVLDNFETLFEPGQREGGYREGLAGYGRLLELVSEGRHQSCLVLTSREAPPELAELGGAAARAFQLGGLGVDEAQALLALKHLVGTSEQWAELTSHFGGNGLALKVVGERIRELYGGEIGSFLEGARASNIFGAIRRLLAEHIERSSAPEQQLMRVLAVEREPMRLAALIAALGERVGRAAVVDALEALRRRSLVERAEAPGAVAFTLQSVVLEYVTDRLVEAVAEEIERGQPVLLVEQPLIQAQAKDYVRQTQERLIGGPSLRRLEDQYGTAGTQQRLLALLDAWRGRPAEQQRYGPGNVVNLLRLLRGDLRGLDLSRLTLRQVYLAQAEAQDASLAGANLAQAVVGDAFSAPLSLALSGDGAFLAAGTSGGEVWLWRVADRVLLLALPGHIGAVMAVALSEDGKLVASGDAGGTVRVWETSTGRVLATLQGDTAGVWSLALSADGRFVASGDAGGPGMVRVWETSSGRPLATLQGHTAGVWSVAVSPDGRLLASGSGDATVCLWETSTGKLLARLQGHVGGVRGLAMAADGELIASGSEDGTVRLWQPGSEEVLTTLQGHSSGVWSVALSADGHLLASGGGDAVVRLWDAGTGRLLRTLQAHTAGVVAVALSADGELLASASEDASVRLWEAGTGRVLATLQGQTGVVWSVALSSDGRLVTSGGGDAMVRLWDTSTGRLLATLQGHTGGVRHVAFSADGRLVASGGWDGTVRLWEAPCAEGDATECWAGAGVGPAPATASSRGPQLATLEDYAGEGVTLSADGRLLASYWRVDGRIRLWELPNGRLRATMQAHSGAVWHAALSADGDMLATGGADGTVRLWEVPGGRLLLTLQAHPSGVSGVALSSDAGLVAGTNSDGTVRLWETSTGRLLAVLDGHTSAVLSVALSADGLQLASAGGDGTVCVWRAPVAEGDIAERWAGAANDLGGSPPTPARWGQPAATLRGHTGAVWRVALSADGRLVASGSWDGTIRVWEASTGACLRVLRPERRYERLDITGLTGITTAQRGALLALGAVEQHATASETTVMWLEATR